MRTEAQKIERHFKLVDPKVGQVLKEIDFGEWFGEELLSSELIFKSLCRTIVGQQLAGKAAEAIYKRFESLLEGVVSPEKLLKLEEQAIRDAGLSWAKVRSVRDLSQKVLAGELLLENLEKLADEELIVELSKVKGIGRWTAEMFLMFRLGRENVFSWGDLGLKNGLKKFTSNPEITVKEMEKIVEAWSPYKTYGAIAMWHLLDNR